MPPYVPYLATPLYSISSRPYIVANSVACCPHVVDILLSLCDDAKNGMFTIIAIIRFTTFFHRMAK